MEKICNINNIGIYLDSNDKYWIEKTKKLIFVQIDGFEKYFENISETYQIVIKNFNELEKQDKSIIVPDNSALFPDGTFYSQEAQIAFKEDEVRLIFWVDKQTWYLPYMIQYILMKEGKTFIHGAGVSVNGEGVLISAFGGIGKTCFIANALKRDNVKLLGDDLVIVSKDGMLTSYPRPFCLYPYHNVLFPDYFKGKKFKIKKLNKNTIITRIIKKLKEILKIKDKTIYNYLTVSPIHLFPKNKLQIEPVPIKTTYLMRRKWGINDIEIKEYNNLEESTNFTQNIIAHEWDLGMRLLFNRSANEFKSLKEYIDNQYDNIKGCLSKSQDIYLIDIPEEMSAEEVSKKLTEILLKE